MSRTTLRPCLKHRADVDPPAPTNSPPLPFALSPSALAPRVHFPPSPGLCQTHLTHSAAIYDRAPIVVLPNACAMPERNGRTFTPPSESCAARKRRSTRAAAQGATLHPQAFAASSYATPAAAAAASSVPDPTGRSMPSLVPDLSSSESDESDISSTPPLASHFPQMGQYQYHPPPISIVLDGAPDAAAAAFAFLPHANEREKPRRERSRSKTRGTRTTVRASEFALPELDGCLGGF
ncbi:hypothetical protein EDB86DRAFT_2834868 [Lactarius hatsudake]|nr:hypothetical protein EDB86DRAFT_2834868 [Lactarius hatsudake]